MAVSVSIQAESVEELRAIFALMGSVALPATATGLTINPAAHAHTGPAANDADKPARQRRTPAKTEEPSADASASAPATASGPAPSEPAANSADQAPEGEGGAVASDEPAEAGEPSAGGAGSAAGADAGGGGGDAPQDLGVIARTKLREVMAKFTPAAMHEIIKAQGVTAVKDIPEAKLPVVIAACDAKLATPAQAAA